MSEHTNGILELSNVESLECEHLPTMDDDHMKKTINEGELIDNASTGTLTSLKLVKTTGGFQIRVQLSWKENELTLITQRKKPREWVSLDRLAQWMDENLKHLPPITLVLRKTKNEKKQPQENESSQPDS